MGKGRLEAFSDGVFAIIITIMVLELRAPTSSDLAALQPLVPVLLSYVLSFTFVGIYWNNHHHMFQAVHRVNGRILWANLHLLFWLSLQPFVTDWLGKTGFAAGPVALYGAVLFMSAVAYTILTIALIRQHGPDSLLAKAVGPDRKGKISLLLYGVAVCLAFVERRISIALYITVAIIWLVPDTRIEKVIAFE